jgi:hypothetical protein
VGHQIIKQPDGLLAVFSSVTDSFILADCNPAELLDYYAQRAAQQARKDTQRVLDAVEAGEPRKVYHQFAMTYDEAVKLHRRHGGEEDMICKGTKP